MKYTLDKMLPLRAFQKRGTPVGGRGLRVYGDGGYTSGDYDPNWLANTFPEYAAANPEPAPSAPEAPAYQEPAYQAPAQDYSQTVNDIYQQEFGRQADASGMASFTAAINAGMTGEQMREALRSSAEGQSYGLSPTAPSTPSAPVGQFEYQPSGYAEFGSADAPYFLNTTTGERREVNPIDAPSKNFVDVNNLAYHLAPNYQGTPTQFYDADGNLKAALIDMVPYGGSGEYAIDPMSLGLALDKGEKVSINSAIQARDEQNRLLFIDPFTGETTPYNTGVPAKSGQTVQNRMYVNDPMYSKRGIIPKDVYEGMALLAATMATGGVGGALMNAAGFGGAAAAGGLTAAEASALMGIEIGAPSLTAGITPAMVAASEAALPTAMNYGAALTTAAKSAAINAAVTAAQGGKPADILRAAGTGAISGGVGALGADYFGAGTIGQIGTQTATAAALAAATGRDPMQAALSGALSATLASVIPSTTSSVLGSLPESVQRAANTAISSSVIAAIQGGNVGTAALMGVANSAISSVAGAIGDTQVVKDLRAAVSSQIDQIVNDFKFNTDTSGARDNPEQQSAGAAPYDANAELDKIIQNLPSYGSASGVEYTPAAPPLVQAAINQNTSNPDDLNQFFANYTPSVGAPLGTYAGATTSDVDPMNLPSGDGVTVNMSGSNKIGDLLDSYNTGIATLGYAPVEMDDEDFLDFARKQIEEENLTPNQSGAANANFLGEYSDLAPSKDYGSAVPQVDAQGNVISAQNSQLTTENTGGLLDYLANFPTEIKNQALGLFEVAMNQLGFVAGNMAAAGYGVGKTYYDLATGEPVDPRKIDQVANEIAKRLSYIPVTTAGQNLNDVVMAIPEALTGSSQGLPPVTNLSALPNVGTIPTPNVGLLSGDLTNAIANAQRGITADGPRSFSTSVGEVVGNLLPKIDPTISAVSENGASNLTVPSRLGYTPETPRLGYTPQAPIARAPLTPERITSLEQMFNDMDNRPTYDVPDRAVRTQLAPESRGALPTTLAEPAFQFNDFGANLDSSSLATITEQAKIVDSNLGSRTEPQRQAQSAVTNETVKTYAPEGADPSVINFWNKTFAEGALSKDVIDGIKDTFDNKSAPPEVILKQVDEATSQLKNLDEQLPAKLEMLSNASKLGITPAEAIELGLLNKNGTKTELGEKVQPQLKPQPKPDPVLPVRPVKPVLPIKPVLPPPPIIYPPPPIVNPPPSSIINPPIDVNPPSVNPPINIDPPSVNPPSIIPPSVNPPLAPSKSAAPKLAAPAASLTPSYMYGVGTQGTTIGALPGNLEGTFLQGANVNEYNPFENYNVYQQLAPIRAAEGGSPLQLAQMQQGITGIDPRLYSALTRRQAPNYFTYGQDTSGGNPTTFAGSQLMGKPSPRIPVIPTGKDSQSDYLYQGSGTNPLARAGAGIANLPSSMMAVGGQAENGGGEGEHIPEFITGATGHYVRGRGDGQSDDIPAMLADGEYVFDASTVSTLGNGSSDAGAKLLDAFRESLRDHTRSAPADKIPPKASPLEYMKEALQNVRRK